MGRMSSCGGTKRRMRRRRGAGLRRGARTGMLSMRDGGVLWMQWWKSSSGWQPYADDDFDCGNTLLLLALVGRDGRQRILPRFLLHHYRHRALHDSAPDIQTVCRTIELRHPKTWPSKRMFRPARTHIPWGNSRRSHQCRCSGLLAAAAWGAVAAAVVQAALTNHRRLLGGTKYQSRRMAKDRRPEAISGPRRRTRAFSVNVALFERRGRRSSRWHYPSLETRRFITQREREGRKEREILVERMEKKRPLAVNGQLGAELAGFFSRPGGSSSIQQLRLASSLTGWTLDEPIFAGISSSVLHPASSIHR